VGIFSSEINEIVVSKDDKVLFESDQIVARYPFWWIGGTNELKVSGLRIRIGGANSAKKQKVSSGSSIQSVVDSIRPLVNKSISKLKSSRWIFSLLGNFKFRILGGEIHILDAKKGKKILPFDCEIKNSSNELLTLKLNSEAFSGEILLSASLSKDFSLKLNSAASAVSLPGFAEGIDGSLNASGKVRASESELNASLSCEIRNFSYKKGNIRIISDPNRHARLDLRINEGEISFSGRGLQTESPIPAQISLNNGRIYVADDILKISTEISINGIESNGKSLAGSHLDLNAEVGISDEGWLIDCEKKENSSEVFAKFAGMSYAGKLQRFSVDLDGKSGLEGKILIDTSDNDMEVKGSNIKIQKLHTVCEIRDGGFLLSTDFEDGFLHKGALEVSGVSCSAKFAGGGLVAEGESLLRASKLEFAGVDYGNFAISGNLGSEGAHMNGSYFFPAAGFELPIELRASLGVEKSFSLSASNKDFMHLNKFDLGTTAKALEGYSFEGDIKVDYLFSIKDGVVSSSFEKKFREASISNPDMGLYLDGVEAVFNSKELNFSRSQPSQRFFARKASFGKSKLSDLELIYALEGPKTFFIERLSAGWCEGKLYLFATRIEPAEKKKFTVYFDRILLSSLLNEFGICEADGEGRMNGRIPISFDGNKIDFDDAFFYSSPGVGGNIKVRKAGSFTSGIPTEGAQFSSIDLTLEALKDFNYDWSKISIDSEGEDIIAKIEFLGRPSGPLPFNFDRRIGAFSRVEAGSRGSLFQQIKLDLNCRFPFNDIMSYINVLKKIIKDRDRGV